MLIYKTALTSYSNSTAMLSLPPKQFKGSIFANPPFGRFVTFLAVFFPLLLILAKTYEGAVIFSLLAGMAAVRLKFRKMEFSSDSFRYDGWFKSVFIPTAEICQVVPAHSFPYPLGRLRSGQMCIVTTKGRYWIQPVWFGPEACRELTHRFGLKN